MIFPGIARPQDIRPLPVPTPTFHDRVWGELRKLHLPSSAVSPGVNQLTSVELSVLAVLYLIQRNQALRHKYSPKAVTDSGVACVTVQHSKLRELTGISKNKPTLALRELEAHGYVRKQSHGQPRNDCRQFTVDQYSLLNPETNQALVSRSGMSLLLANGVKYFTVPVVVFDKPHIFASMSVHAQQLYLTICWQATVNRSNSFDATMEDLRNVTGLSAFTFSKALAEVQEHFLLAAIPKGRTLHKLHIVLYDPTTQEPISAGLETSDYYEEDSPGAGIDPNTDPNRFRLASFKLEQDDAERRVTRELLAIGETYTTAKNGDLRFRCPFHNDSTPSFSFNPEKGCFYCFGCGRSGTTLALLNKLRANKASRGTAGTPTATQTAAGIISELRPTARHIRPDSEAEAIYNYYDQNDRLLKQKLKFREPDGSATYWQRQPDKDGRYIYSVKNLKPMLFNRNLFLGAHTAFICEGEKDCCTMQALRISGTVATTSGSATSWDVRLAKDLKTFSNVIIMPDADAAGERYSQQIQDSLLAEGIPFRVVSFHGTGAKDVSEYMETHSIEDLQKLIGYEQEPIWETEPIDIVL